MVLLVVSVGVRRRARVLQTFQGASPRSHSLFSSVQSRKVSMPIQKPSCG